MDQKGKSFLESGTMEVEVYVIPEGSDANTVMQGFSEGSAEDNTVAGIKNRYSNMEIANSEANNEGNQIAEKRSDDETETEVDFYDNEDCVEDVDVKDGVSLNKMRNATVIDKGVTGAEYLNNVESDEDYEISVNDLDSEDSDISDNDKCC